MKPTKLFFLLLTSITLLNSCKKGIGELKDNNSQMAFKVDGVNKKNWGDENVQTFYFKKEKTMQILGNMITENISLTIYPFRGVGEYDAETEVLATYSPSNDDNIADAYIGVSGKIKITSFVDNRVKGEFSFVADDTSGKLKKITEGTFDSKVSVMEMPVTP